MLLCNASRVFVGKLVAGEGRGQGYGTGGGVFNGSHQDEGLGPWENHVKTVVTFGLRSSLFWYVQILVVVGKSPVLAYSHFTWLRKFGVNDQSCNESCREWAGESKEGWIHWCCIAWALKLQGRHQMQRTWDHRENTLWCWISKISS